MFVCVDCHLIELQKYNLFVRNVRGGFIFCTFTTLGEFFCWQVDKEVTFKQTYLLTRLPVNSLTKNQTKNEEVSSAYGRRY